MAEFETLPLPGEPSVRAPDGSEVRELLAVHGGSMAQFSLPAGAVAKAVAHRTVDEIWYVVSGTGQLWRKQGKREEIVALLPGLCVSIPQGTHFQFRASTTQRLSVVATTMPPWLGADEAVVVQGPWRPTVD